MGVLCIFYINNKREGGKGVLSPKGAILIFFLTGFFLSIIILVLNYLLSPKSKSLIKRETYECGLETIGPTWVQFKGNYFMYALVFVLFDVETIFLYPWAVRFNVLGLFAFVEMVIFIGILVLGLWYAWKEGALEWK